MDGSRKDNPLKIPEISADEFRACVDQDDFLWRYGNPVVIRSGGQRDVVCMAREYYELLMQERDLFIEDAVAYNAFYCGHWHTEKQDGKLRILFHDVIMLA